MPTHFRPLGSLSIDDPLLHASIVDLSMMSTYLFLPPEVSRMWLIDKTNPSCTIPLVQLNSMPGK